MKKDTTKNSQEDIPSFAPALSPDARQTQMIALAMNCAEQQLRDGTASSQIITHFLKLGTIQAELELEKIRLENENLKAKTAAIESSEDVARLTAEAINAFKSYSGRMNEVVEETIDEY